jgi:hypothetical protein
MRTKAAFGIAVALTLVAAGASAAESKGDTGGKGGNGPGTNTSEPDNGAGDVVPPDAAHALNPDMTSGRPALPKVWEVGASVESHRMIRQEDLNNPTNKFFNVFGLFARYDLTEHDRISVSESFQQQFIADQGETGLRSDDVLFAYTRTHQLPRQFVFSGRLGISAPTSFQSQKAGMIASPSLALQLDKRFGKYVGVSARVTGIYFIPKYRETEGGGANPKAGLGGTLEAEVVMPFHEPLSVGADIGTRYSWYYEVQDGGGTVTTNGVVNDATFPSSQPVQQSYGGEVYVRYVLPSLAGLKSDIMLALADGDPTLGYNSVLHDGVSQYYLFFRETAEVYGSFTVRY